MSNELLSVKQVADWLRFRDETVRRWFRSGRLRGSRVGNALRFRRCDVVEAMERDGDRRQDR